LPRRAEPRYARHRPERPSCHRGEIAGGEGFPEQGLCRNALTVPIPVAGACSPVAAGGVSIGGRRHCCLPAGSDDLPERVSAVFAPSASSSGAQGLFGESRRPDPRRDGEGILRDCRQGWIGQQESPSRVPGAVRSAGQIRQRFDAPAPVVPRGVGGGSGSPGVRSGRHNHLSVFLYRFRHGGLR